MDVLVPNVCSDKGADKHNNIYTLPIFHAILRDSYIGKNQTLSLFVGLLKDAARRAIIIPDFGYEKPVKIDSKIPVFLRL
jgi:hypothetical protein